MDSYERTIVDWVNLPEDVNELSLWSTLHDGDLTAIESDLLARTLTVRFDVDYVRKFHNFADETQFVVIVSGVQSVRSFRGVPWPGACSIPALAPHEQKQALVAEYRSKWREESLSWADFERLANDGLEVSTATLGQRSDGAALRLVFFGASFVEAYVRGEEITFSIGERQLTPEEFVEVGEAYWEAFARKAAHFHRVSGTR